MLVSLLPILKPLTEKLVRAFHLVYSQQVVRSKDISKAEDKIEEK